MSCFRVFLFVPMFLSFGFLTTPFQLFLCLLLRSYYSCVCFFLLLCTLAVTMRKTSFVGYTPCAWDPCSLLSLLNSPFVFRYANNSCWPKTYLSSILIIIAYYTRINYFLYVRIIKSGRIVVYLPYIVSIFLIKRISLLQHQTLIELNIVIRSYNLSYSVNGRQILIIDYETISCIKYPSYFQFRWFKQIYTMMLALPVNKIVMHYEEPYVRSRTYT